MIFGFHNLYFRLWNYGRFIFCPRTPDAALVLPAQGHKDLLAALGLVKVQRKGAAARHDVVRKVFRVGRRRIGDAPDDHRAIVGGRLDLVVGTLNPKINYQLADVAQVYHKVHGFGNDPVVGADVVVVGDAHF